MVRRVRRTADLSQRALERILAAAGYHLEVVDRGGHVVLPLEVRQDTEDGAGRRYPAHLDTILDPVFGDWWADDEGWG